MSESSAQNVLPGSATLIVDSWGMLEWAYGNEPAAQRFRQRLDAASRGDLRLLLCRLNQGEVRYNLVKELGFNRADELIARIAALPLFVVSVDDALVDAAAELKARFPIAYADCFVAALAMRYRSPVITGDDDFRRLEKLGILSVDWIGA